MTEALAIATAGARMSAEAEARLVQVLSRHVLTRREPSAETVVAYGQPDPTACIASRSLRWVHLSTAGYTPYGESAVRTAFMSRGIALTTSSSVYAEPCAQHALAFLLAHARQLPAAFANQAGVKGWPQADLRARSTLLGGQTVLLVGMGSIGRRLATLLAPFAMNVIGVRRRPAPDEPVPTRPMTELHDLLPKADVVVDLLPASIATERCFDRARLARLPRHAVFMNIGRGSTVDQDALLAALNTEALAAAYLDVTTPEPLPPAHPLWSHPRCVITPHSAGGHAGEELRLVQHFALNVDRFCAGQPLLDRVL